MMDRHYITNIEGENKYHPKCISLVELLVKLADNELKVMECEQIHLINLAQLPVNQEMTITPIKIKRII